MKHREFWIDIEINKPTVSVTNVWKTNCLESIHVIEYAAYEELEAENARLKEALEDQGKLVRRLSEMFKEDGDGE